MRKTGCYVSYELYDTTALDDGVEQTNDNQSFGNLGLFKEALQSPRYGTLEQNFFTLDGSMDEFPDEPEDLTYFSKQQAGNDGYFQDNPQITVTFTENHTSAGITLHFLDVYPLEIEITWSDLYGTQISKQTFYPDTVNFFAKNQVEEYGMLKIEFIRTLPGHNIKLQKIEYGTTYVWGENIIKEAKIINEMDPISHQIKVDKLTFKIIDKDDDFNIGNISGMHKTFQKKQKMKVHEKVNENDIMMGVFFLDGNSTSKNISQITAIDYKGMLDNTDFKEGKIYDKKKAGELIDEIMAAAGIEDYTVDEETYEKELSGTLPIQTCRKALREVLFASGAVINTARRESVEIKQGNRKVVSSIKRGRKFSTTLKTDHYISDVNVKYKTWKLNEEVIELTKGTYGVGTHLIKFTNPVAEVSSSVGTIQKQNAYYAELLIEEDPKAEVIISGKKWEAEELSVLSSIEKIKSGEVRSTKNFTGTLLDYTRAKEVADKILNYYQLQQIIQTKYMAEEEKAGDWCEIENPDERHSGFLAGIEKVTVNLAAGFIETAELRGYYKTVSETYYAGELITGEEFGVM